MEKPDGGVAALAGLHAHQQGAPVRSPGQEAQRVHGQRGKEYCHATILPWFLSLSLLLLYLLLFLSH